MTTVLFEVDSRVRMDRLEEWARYARSRPNDTRIALILPVGAKLKQKDKERLRQLGVGLYLSDGNHVTVEIPPMDVAVNVQLPNIRRLPVRVRRVLGSVYEKFDRAEWREGFQEACQVLEDEARKYLKAGVASGRLVFFDRRGRVRNLDSGAIDALSMGGLATAFSQIQTQNHADAVIGRVLTQVNADRNAITHFRGRPATETRLRKNVGQHMWSVIAALRELLKP